MRYFFLYCLSFSLFLSCKKEQASKVEIYMLKSFTMNVDQATNPATLTISNAVLADAPLVADQNITFYTKSTATFQLERDINAIIHDYGADKAFAVTVNKQPVYFGLFHPAYLSSITFGVATIDPILYNNNQLPVQFATLAGSQDLQPLDKRNDTRLLNALKASGRLR